MYETFKNIDFTLNKHNVRIFLSLSFSPSIYSLKLKAIIAKNVEAICTHQVITL